MVTEVLFYHLERQSLEQTLPGLLQRCLERGWRAAVQVGGEDRLRDLDSHLWTYNDAAFLPHGTAADGHEKDQPVFLTTNTDNPNGASVRFLVDGATTDSFEGYERIVFLFDGADQEATATAREAWKAAVAAGTEATYWRQDERGKWGKQA